MQIKYKPNSVLEKFGQKVHNLLVENFPQTFFVGGMVRDLLLGRKLKDIDIATGATPDQIISMLKKGTIDYQNPNAKFGSVTARQGSLEVEITTLRKDLRSNSRYPKVKFIKSPKQDSQRRDFSINSLYLRAKDSKILDFHQGLGDLKSRRLKFIGNPKQRIKQDPLRIVRALRFALVLNFKLESKTKLAIKNNFALLQNLTQTKITKEIFKINSAGQRQILKSVLGKPKLLDKYFK